MGHFADIGQVIDRSITVVIGMKSIGKTFTTNQYINEYKGKVLVLDPHCEYNQLKALKEEEVRPFCQSNSTEARRIIVEQEDWKKMRSMVFIANEHFRGGLLVLEDVYCYMTDLNDAPLCQLLITNRARDVDLILHIQSPSHITTRMWQNCSYVRLHHHIDVPSRYADRVPFAELFLVGSFLTRVRYGEGDKRFYCTLDMSNRTLSGDFSLKYYKKICKAYVKTLPTYRGLFKFFVRRWKVKYLLTFYGS